MKPLEISAGDFVANGGEVPAMLVIDTVIRLIPGVLGDATSFKYDSFAESGLLEYPQYTRPASYRGWSVPEVLRSGDHAAVERWRRQESLRRTQARRPDLLATASLSEEEQALLRELGWEESSPGDG